MLRDSSSTSTNTGFAPTRRITLAVAAKLIAVVMTSSPSPIPAMRRAISSAAVALVKSRTVRPPKNFESSASNAAARGPVVIQPDRRTSATAAIVASSSAGRANGRNAGRRVSSMAAPHQEIDTGADERDAADALGGEVLAEQHPRGERIDDVADGEQRISDAYLDAGERDDPHRDADDVTGKPTDDRRRNRELAERLRERANVKIERAHAVRPGFQEELG